MKKKNFWQLLTVGLVAMMTLIGCKKDEGETPQPNEPEGELTGVVEIPEGSNLSSNSIEVYQDGQKVELNANGKFESQGENFLVTNKENKIVYLAFTSVEPQTTKREITLNSTEMAISILSVVFPNVFDMSEENFQSLRKLIENLPETKLLATAIDNSIVKNGYFKIEEVEKEYDNAVDKITELIGLKKPLPPISPMEINTPNSPKLPKKMHKGIRLDMKESKYIPESNSWECTFTAYSDRFAYASLMVAQKNSNGLVTNFPDKYVDQMQYILSPMSSAKFMKVYTTWNGISNFLSETGRLISEKGYGFGDLTFDKTKLEDIKLTFQNPNDVVLVLSPQNSNYLYFYTVSVAVIKPVITSLGIKFDDESTATSFVKQFVFEMVTDVEFVNEIAIILKDSNIGSTKKYTEIGKKIFDRLIKELKNETGDILKKFLKEKANTGVKKFLLDVENINAINKVVLTATDLLGKAIGVTTEESFYFDVELNFFDLQVAQDDVEVEKEKIIEVYISGSSGNIEVSSSSQEIATATLSDDKSKVRIRGMKEGESRVVITDNQTNQTKTIIVRVKGIPTGVSIENGVLQKWPCDKIPIDGKIIIPNSVTSIGAYAFKGCLDLVSVTLPETVVSISIHAFDGCQNLVSINLPNTITTIGAHAFNNCNNLASITLPESIKVIPSGVFSGCMYLKEVHIPDGVTHIGERAFADNTSLKKVVMGKKINLIGPAAFSGCINLQTIQIKNLVPPSYYSNSTYSHSFYRTNNIQQILVPTQSVDIYKSNSYWGGFGDKIKAQD